MLYKLIKENRDLLLSRSANLSALSGEHSDIQTDALGHVSVFLDQLTETLHIEHDTSSEAGKPLARTTSPAPAVQMSDAAYGHGCELRDWNLTIDTLVRNYGSVCQAITGYAVEVSAPIDVAEFKTLNWCLDEAIAQAVIAFTKPAPPDAWNLKLARLKHDARLDDMAMMTNHIDCIANAIAAMRTGRVGLDGDTGTLLDASLNAMRVLVQQGIDQRI